MRRGWRRRGTVRGDGALWFQRALASADGASQARVRVNLHPGVGHAAVRAMMDACFAWFEEHG